jgi:hypothetical protein
MTKAGIVTPEAQTIDGHKTFTNRATFIDGITATITGNITGNVTGNVTGNCSGSAGSCTGNAATATTAGACTGNAATATTAGACTGNAVTVTDGVYTTGNQSINGIKTFASLILPVIDPVIDGALWNDGGVIKVSVVGA